MSDPEWRAKLVEEYNSGKGPTLGGGTDAEATPGAGDGIPTMIIEHAQTDAIRKYEGMLMGDIAKDRGQHVVECLLDIVLAEDLKTELKAHRSLVHSNQ